MCLRSRPGRTYAKLIRFAGRYARLYADAGRSHRAATPASGTSVQVLEVAPQLRPGPAWALADTYRLTLLLVVDADPVVERGPHTAGLEPGREPSTRIGVVDQHDGGGRVRRAAEVPQRVVPAVRRRQPQLPPVPVQGSILAVVAGDDDRSLPLRDRDLAVHRGHLVDVDRPSDGVPGHLVHRRQGSVCEPALRDDREGEDERDGCMDDERRSEDSPAGRPPRGPALEDHAARGPERQQQAERVVRLAAGH